VQFDHVVLGLEADGSGSWIKGETIGTDPFSGNCGGAVPRCFSNLQSLATFRARAGVAVDNVLPYVTGGLAVGWLHGQEGDSAANGAFGAGTTTVVGWTAGGGIEALFGPHWSAKAEYLTSISAIARYSLTTLPERSSLKTSDIPPVSCASA
jgi:outer membrane immunogenic protein